MTTGTRVFAVFSIGLALGGIVQPAALRAAAGSATTTQQSEAGLKARPGLTAAEIETATKQAAQLAPKMTVLEVEAIIGKLSVAGRTGALDDMLNALPPREGTIVTGTNGIYRFDFVSNRKGRFHLTSWTLLPGAQPSQ